jgi:hypothetical protein
LLLSKRETNIISKVMYVAALGEQILVHGLIKVELSPKQAVEAYRVQRG